MLNLASGNDKFCVNVACVHVKYIHLYFFYSYRPLPRADFRVPSFNSLKARVLGKSCLSTAGIYQSAGKWDNSMSGSSCKVCDCHQCTVWQSSMIHAGSADH